MIREPHSIRLARPDDVGALPEIERVASLMFKSFPGDLGIPEELYEQPNSVETFAAAQKAGHLWVAIAPRDTPVGFALVVEINRYAHLEELDVLPSHGRQGIGSSLVDVVCSWAREAVIQPLRSGRFVTFRGTLPSTRSTVSPLSKAGPCPR